MFTNLIRLFSPSTLPAINFEHDAVWYRVYLVRRLFALGLLGTYVAFVAAASFFVAPLLGALFAVGFAPPLYLLFVWLDPYWLGGMKQQETAWEDPALKLVRKALGPSDKEWMAALELGLDKDFPHWRTMIAQSPNDASRFLAGKARLERDWLKYKPDYSDNLVRDAFLALIEAKNHYNGALAMHDCYQHWDIAQIIKKRPLDAV